MSYFINNPILEPLDDGIHWRLVNSFSYNDGELICVPSNFITDFASVPKIFWNIIPPWGRYGKAAILHDYLYSTLGLKGKYSRKECDKIFLNAMQILNVSAWKRYVMYYSVRLFGWKAWNNYKRRSSK